MIKLISSDNEVVLLPRSAANIAVLVANALNLEDEEEERKEYDPVTMERVDTKALKEVVKFLILNRDTPMQEIGDPSSHPIPSTFVETVPQECFREYVEALGLDLMYRVRKAANFMGIESLYLLTNVWLTFHLMGKSVEEMHEILYIPVMTEEQAAQARLDHPWLFVIEDEADDADEAPAP